MGTGTQATIQPVAFSTGFGLPLPDTSPLKDHHDSAAKPPSSKLPVPTAEDSDRNLLTTTTLSSISLLGVRQLAAGIALFAFALQYKWREIATILAINGVLVAGTDGFYLARVGTGRAAGLFHAVPGLAIAGLAYGVLYFDV